MTKFLVLCLLTLICVASGKNKYSKEANQGTKANSNRASFSADEDEPTFRMAKINQLWTKAKKILAPKKLEALRSDLSMQDKQEVTWKRMKVEGGDRDGLKEAQLRTQLLATLNRYGLGRYQPDPASAPAAASPPSEAHAASAKRLFKDKKLNRLWEKAEKSGFSQEELKTLREEFQHHQERVDEYYQLIEEHQQTKEQEQEQEQEMSNSLFEDGEPSLKSHRRNKSHADYKSRINELHAEIGRGYDTLHVTSVNGPDGRQFTEPKVDGLWQVARAANFNTDELQSLWTELKHYELRLQKLRHVQRDMSRRDERHPKEHRTDLKTEGRKVYDRKIKDHEREVEKLQIMLEEKIMSRHTEL